MDRHLVHPKHRKHSSTTHISEADDSCARIVGLWLEIWLPSRVIVLNRVHHIRDSCYSTMFSTLPFAQLLLAAYFANILITTSFTDQIPSAQY
ncbi:hypothetical protein K503DRAFT_769579 [Rhizopogon vinicolor AM-OR11-026]|uniref:Uncharacterized protein n=1 Tax=Rhizopogon vinicolor AM-OR11-026 TaxID=1314800 RepID=A0A1B7N3A7_9AGAM|nr:hypothetical protein K503DRAFT_769577 [Rhizopogon vinicolor AM-OR11-026]OAX39337.1 hypothetical protein K503DRAFT_769579 [Rhizopogon vinicolor AM-OR11-026]